MRSIIAGALCLTLAATQATALDPSEIPTHDGSADLQRVKALAGSWSGEMDMNGVQRPIKVTYKVTAGGSAVMETLHPGSPMEMVSMYHDTGGKLGMVHYCMLGNQPHMALKASGDSHVTLEMADTTGVSDPKESHMHALTITFIDENTIEHEWTLYEDGDASEVTTFALTRTSG